MASGGALVAELELAIQALYTTANETVRREAHSQLLDFFSRPDAWNVCLQLLQSDVASVQFFALTMLSNKVDKSWREQADGLKEDIHARVLAAVRDHVHNPNSKLSSKALQRLCLIHAKIAVLSPSLIEHYVQELWSYLEVGLGAQASNETQQDRALQVCTTMLVYLPEERDALNLSAASALDPASAAWSIQSLTPRALEAITHLMQQSSPKLHARALECLQRWAVDVATLARCSLLRPLLVAVNSCQDEAVVQEASSALVACIKKSEDIMLKTDGGSEVMTQALDEVVEGLLACRSRLSGSMHTASDDAVALSLCQATVAVAEAQMDRIVAGETPQLLSLVDLIMAFTGHASLAVALATLNFWLLVQDTALSERHEALREPCFMRLLEVLLRQCRLPADATSGTDDVEFELENFRNSSDGVKDPLANIFLVLGPQFLQALHSILKAASDWQTLESALFALAAASQEIVKHTTGAAAGPRGAAVLELTESIITELVNSPMIGANGATLLAGTKLIGNFGKILAKMKLPLIERSLGLTIPAMAYSASVSTTAAEAFLNICTACRLELSMHPDGVKSLIQLIEGAIERFPEAEDEARSASRGAASFPTQARVSIVQGVARVASCMPVGACTETLAALLNPVISRLRQAVEDCNSVMVVKELESLRTAVSFLVTSNKHAESAGEHPVAHILHGTLPILERIYSVPALQLDGEVVSAMYGLLSTSFVCARHVLAPHLDSLLRTAINHFKATHSPCCITCVGKAVEIFAGESIESSAAFSPLFDAMVEAIVEAIRAGHTASNPEIIDAFFRTAQLFLLFAPSALFQPQSNISPGTSPIEIVLQIIIKCVASDELTSTRSLLLFLSTLLTRFSDARYSAFKPVFDSAVSRQGSAMVEQMLIGLAVSTPAGLTSRQAQALADVTIVYTGQIQGWVYTALVNNPKTFVSVPDQVKEAFVSTVPELAALVSKAREVFTKFGMLAREQMSSGDFLSFLSEARRAITDLHMPPGEVIDLS